MSHGLYAALVVPQMRLADRYLYVRLRTGTWEEAVDEWQRLDDARRDPERRLLVAVDGVENEVSVGEGYLAVRDLADPDDRWRNALVSPAGFDAAVIR